MAAELEMTTDEKTEGESLQIGGEDVKVEMPQTREIDLHARDPHGMNEHIKVRFQDIIAEPDEEIFSFDAVWTTSYKTFTLTKLWCYRITSLLFAVPLSVCWGIYFACLAFCSAWVCLPCIKSEEIECLCLRRIWNAILNSFVAPCFEAMGKCFSGFRVHAHMAKGSD